MITRCKKLTGLFLSFGLAGVLYADVSQPTLLIDGLVMARGTILGENGEPIWVEYSPDGEEVREIGEAVGHLKGAYTFGAGQIQFYLAAASSFSNQYASALVLHYSEFHRISEYFQKPDGSPVSYIPTAGTASVMVPGVSGYVVADENHLRSIILEVPFDLRTIDKPIAGRNVLLYGRDYSPSQFGQVLAQTSGDQYFGYRSGFYGNEYRQATEANDTLSRRRPEDEVYNPVQGAGIFISGNGVTVSDSSGHYAVNWLPPGCVGQIDIPLTLTTQVYFNTFTPRGRTPAPYSLFRDVSLHCQGSMPYTPTNLSGAMAQVNQQDIVNQYQSTQYRIDVLVDVVVISGKARFANPEGASSVLAIPLGDGETQYDMTPQKIRSIPPPPTDWVASPYDLDGDGIYEMYKVVGSEEWIKLSSIDDSQRAHADTPDLKRPYQPNLLAHVGLVTEINREDARNTDLYVFDDSSGQLLVHKEGVLDFFDPEETEGLENESFFRAYVTGPQDANSAHRLQREAAQLSMWGSTPISGSEHEKPSTFIAPGDFIQVVLINRKTGYLASKRVRFLPESGSITLNLDDMVLRPPNLKLWAERHGFTGGEEGEFGRKRVSRQMVGAEGSALSDEVLVIHSEWLAEDGSPLPAGFDDTDGFLLQVAATSQLTTIETLTIKPGRKSQMVRVGQQGLDREHFYLLLHADPARPDYSQYAAHKLRPRSYVPFLVARFDEELGREILEAMRNMNQPSLAEYSLKDLYTWLYHPELQFSLFDLKVDEITIERTEEKLKTTIDHSLTGGGPILDRHGTERQFVWTVSYLQLLSEYRDLLLGSSGNSTISGPVEIDMSRDLLDAFEKLKTELDQLTVEDILAIQLGQSDDQGNPLYQFQGELLVPPFNRIEPIRVLKTHFIRQGDADELPAEERDEGGIARFLLTQNAKVKIYLLNESGQRLKNLYEGWGNEG